MREIKFRAWDDKGKIFHHWGFNLDGIGAAWFHGPPSLPKAPQMQSTGLLDKQGVEIYEGDIVTAGDNYPSLVVWDEIEAKFELFEKYPRRGRYADKFDRYHDMTAYTDGLGEVIGNRYENPELLAKLRQP